MRLFLLVLLSLFLLSPVYAKAALVEPGCKKTKSCVDTLLHYPLFDTAYKLAANYVPILPLRGMAHAQIYQKKKHAHLVRTFYVKDLSGKFSESYETMDLHIDVKGKGFFGREIIAKGHLNDFDVFYKNHISCSLPKNAKMEVEADIAGIEFLNLHIRSDGSEMTNKVHGSFMGRDVDYKTEWRNTKGKLSGLSYEVYAEGVKKEEDEFKVILKGKISEYKIYGSGHMVAPGKYEFTEHYGPILVKSLLTVRD